MGTCMGKCLPATAASYPGNTRVAKPVYQPGDDEYTQINSTTAVANAHFVTCPGGTALKLIGKPNRAATPAGSEGLAKYISVTLPPGVHAGDVIHVQAPDGRMNAIAVPPGMGPGSTFTVEFSGEAPPPPPEEELTPGVYVPTVVAEPEVEAGVPTAPTVVASYGTQGEGREEAVAQPTTGPYVPAYSTTKY